MPTVVSKLSTRTGLIYTYTRDPAGLAIGPTSTAYLGVTGGLIALRDG